jgi:predicted DNA-binding protein with PD1-like motif
MNSHRTPSQKRIRHATEAVALGLSLITLVVAPALARKVTTESASSADSREHIGAASPGRSPEKELTVTSPYQDEFISPADIKADKPAPHMATRQLDEHTWVVIFSSGDEIYSGLTAWALEHHVQSGYLTAVGAWKSAVLGYYDLTRKAYRRHAFDQQMELLSLVGNFALNNEQPFLHAHAVVGLSDGATRGGHLLEAYASPTTEVFVTVMSGSLRREPDDKSGLHLIVPNVD